MTPGTEALMDPIEAMLSVVSFVFGASIGSFLNVVIWRVPRGESIVRPPSHCPRCGSPIRWYQNIPIVSWLALRGRCANCRAPISPRYILVETLTGVLFLAAFMRYGNLAPLAWVWIALMIVGSFIDFDLRLLPDFVTVGGMIYGVSVAAVVWVIAAWFGVDIRLFSAGSAAWPVHSLYPFALEPLWSIVGLAFGLGLLWLIRFLGTLAFRREAMGLGDVLLMGGIGAIFGFEAVLVTLVLSAVAGSVVGVALILVSKVKLGSFVEIPYGPYICMGCLAWMFWGPELVNWYLNILSPL